MSKQFSAQEIAAAAGVATTAKIAAETAKKAMDAAPDDANLKSAYETAQKAADDAQQVVNDLSQAGPRYTPEQIQKMKRRRAIIDAELQKSGESDSKDDDDDIDPLEIDPDKPLTMRDLQRIEREKSSKTTEQMATTITDPLLRKAVQDAIKDVVPSGNPEADFKKAVAIANIEKNSKILEELGRKVTPPQHRSGAGAPPPKEDDAFVPTAEEQRFMTAFGLTKEAIIASRPKQQ